MVSITFGNLTAQEPNAILRTCEAGKLPTDWYGLANRYVCPIGLSAGRGHVLLLRSQLDKLDLTKYQPLRFAENTLNSGVEFPKMRIVGYPRCLDFGAPDPCYLVEFADRRIDLLGMIPDRWQWRQNPTNTSVATGTDTVATWPDVAQYLWNVLTDLGTWPGLPDDVPTPDENVVDRLDFDGFTVRDALTDALAAVGCGAYYDPISDTFSVTYFPTVTDRADQLLSQSRLPLIYDERPYLPKDYGPLPATVVVLFPVWQPGRDYLKPRQVYGASLDLPTDLQATGVSKTTAIAYIQDFTPLRKWTDDFLANDVQIATRAKQVARIFYDRFTQNNSRTPVRRAVSGFARWTPGDDFDVVTWQDTGRGPMTSAVRTGILASTELYEAPASTGLLTTLPTTLAKNAAGAVLRVGGWPKSEGEASPSFVSIAGMDGPLIDKAGSLRQGEWASIGNGARTDQRARLWRNWEDTPPDDMVRMVKVTGGVSSLSVGGGSYPAYPCQPLQQVNLPPSWRKEETGWLLGANGETLVSTRAYMARAGMLADDGKRIWATFCCDSSSSPVGNSDRRPDHPSGTITTACCSNKLPATLYGVCFSTLACINGTTIQFDEVSGHWEPTLRYDPEAGVNQRNFNSPCWTGPVGKAVTGAILQCTSASIFQLDSTTGYYGMGGTPPAYSCVMYIDPDTVTIQCDPFRAVFHGRIVTDTFYGTAPSNVCPDDGTPFTIIITG